MACPFQQPVLRQTAAFPVKELGLAVAGHVLVDVRVTYRDSAAVSEYELVRSHYDFLLAGTSH